jgi:FkbM family methyltransferase
MAKSIESGSADPREESMSVKRWCLRQLRRAVGTQPLLDALARQKKWAESSALDNGQASPLETAAIAEMEKFLGHLVDPHGDDQALGFRRDQSPCLIDMNGDLLWIPGDLLQFLWHTRVAGRPAMLPHFLAETPHYLWIREQIRPGDTVLDCGANLGLFSTMMARRVGPQGRVHAFEPSPGSSRDLARVLVLNGLAQQVVINVAAVSDACGEAVFYDVTVGDVRREASHLDALGRSGLVGGLDHQEVRVPTVTLDDYIQRQDLAPRLVKIDVEGAEFLVLEGARRSVAAHHPLLVIEIHPDERGEFDHGRLEAYLLQYGYRHRWQDKTYYCEPC